MKSQLSFCLFLVAVIVAACSKESDDPKPTMTHVGEKWNITTLEYNLIDQNLTSPTIKNGTASNAGAFYFDGAKGSFDIKIDAMRKEDVFGFSLNSSDITIVSIEQSVQTSTFSQNVIALSGEKATTTMTLSGTITKQSLTGQFVLTGTFTLTKE